MKKIFDIGAFILEALLRYPQERAKVEKAWKR